MKILFLCRGNVGRSQIAEGLFNTMQTQHQGISAGVALSGPECSLAELFPKAQSVIDVMAEEDVDVSLYIRKQLTEDMVNDADRVVLIMEDETDIPPYLSNSKKLERWNIPDPKGKDYQFTKDVKEQIKKNLEKFIAELKLLN